MMLKKKLMHRFDVSLVLGMHLIRSDREELTLTIARVESTTYTKSVLERVGMAECNPVTGAGAEMLSCSARGNTTIINETGKLL